MSLSSTLATDPLVAVLRGPDAATVADAAVTLVDAGIRHIEITFTTPGAERAIADVVTRRPGAVVGAGTVVTAGQAHRAVDVGAAFLVSPGAPAALVEAMVATGVTAVPGVLTASEVLTALGAGAQVVKLFPAATVGPSYLRHLTAPLPDLRIVPSGGIALDGAAEWLHAGAIGVGLGALATPAMIAARDGDAMRAAAAAALAPLKA